MHTPRSPLFRRHIDQLQIIGAIARELNAVADENSMDEIAAEQNPLDESNEINILYEVVKDYCSNSSVHTVRYFTKPNRHWIERLWWVICVAMAVISCIFGIWIVWVNWDQRPVVIVFDNKITQISTIPFPAVTICSTQKFFEKNVNMTELNSAFKIKNDIHYLNSNISDKSLNQLNAIAQTCLLFVHMAHGDNVIIPKSPSIYETIKDMTTHDQINTPHTFSANEKLGFGYKPIFTAEGLCYTFNSFNSQEIYSDEVAPELLTVHGNPNGTHWNREEGYHQANVEDFYLYPYRVFHTDTTDFVLTFLETWLDDSYRLCKYYAPGFHLKFHMPDELPSAFEDVIHVPLGHVVIAYIKPNIISTSNDLRSYTAHERGCFFQSERRLRFFKSYSRQKCEMECLANLTKSNCNCVRFHMPRDNSTRICTIVDYGCFFYAQTQFKSEPCECLPDCFSISYESTHSYAPSSSNQYFTKSNIPNNNRTELKMFNKVIVAFKTNHFIALNRTVPKESFTLMDFIASCGALLALFLGASVLSFIELVYYFTVRLYLTWCKRKKRHRNAIAPQEIH